MDFGTFVMKITLSFLIAVHYRKVPTENKAKR